MNKERIDNLLQDIQKLEKQVAGMRDEEIYLLSSFTQSFDLAHKVLIDIHSLEIDRLDSVRKQLEEHQRIINSISSFRPTTPTNPVNDSKSTTEPTPQIEASTEVILKTSYSLIKEDIIQEEKEVVLTEPVALIEPTTTFAPSLVIEEPSPITNKESGIATEKKTTVFLNEILEKNNFSDFRKAFSLNDRFRFKRELFGGDETKMNKAISELNDIHSYEESISYLQTELKWHTEDETVTDFIKLLEKRFL